MYLDSFYLLNFSLFYIIVPGAEFSLCSNQHRTDRKHHILHISNTFSVKSTPRLGISDQFYQNSTDDHNDPASSFCPKILVSAEASSFFSTRVFL